MQKRSVLFLFLLVSILFFFSISVVLADEHNTTLNETVDAETETNIVSEVEAEYGGAELGEEAGTTPDSALYFLDEFFDNFGDDLKVREEKVAEIGEMIRQGKVEEAREALDSYLALAEKLEAESDPDRRDDTRRSAAAIRNAINELESEIPEEFRKEFVADVLEKEEGIITAAEISSKIKELCEQLSSLDPVEYSRVCITEDDAPDWHKKLDKKLTEEQREEALRFGEIMGECFETSGQQCKCEEIPFKEFAEMCSVAAPLVVKCDIEGDEQACEQMDNLEIPELPPHLQEVFDALEGDVSESQLEVHMPRECREAGANSPKECMRIMIQTNAPEECRDALLGANVQNEREARELCEKIMFEQNAPEECIERGLTNPRECGKLMFQLNAPQECLDAGLTGDSRGDEKKCREIMESQGRGERRGQGGFGGANCRGIQDQMERLKCYDGASQGAHDQREDFEERFRLTKEQERQCAQQCASQNKAWNFVGGNCECFEGSREDYSEFYDEGSRPDEEFSEQPSTTPTTEESTTNSDTTSGSDSSAVDSDTSEPTSITGSAISGHNSFLNYFFG